MAEINLMDRFPEAKRSEAVGRQPVTEEDRAVARSFGSDYFDNAKFPAYRGYRYDPRFWRGTVERLRTHYALPADSRILDVGCAKGYLLRDFLELMPDALVRGVDISDYALAHADPLVRPFLQKASAHELPFEDDSFDLVISIKVLSCIPYEQSMQALREIQRVSRKHAFVVVNAWRNEAEKQLQERLSLALETTFSVEDWKAKFAEIGYEGDYWWDIHQ